MKQASRWFLCCTLAAALALTGCGGGNSGSSSGSVSGSTSAGSSAAQSAAWRTGLGVLTEATGTDRAGNIHTVAAAVLLDADGKLAGVTLDELELSVSADGTGKVTTPTDTRTKRQKGKDYPLAEVSGLKKGWAEQADAFGSWLEGKTPEEVKKRKRMRTASQQMQTFSPAAPSRWTVTGMLSSAPARMHRCWVLPGVIRSNWA